MQTHKRWATCVQGALTEMGLVASKSEARKRSNYSRPGQISFDERSYKLATLTVESFGRFGKEGRDLIDQVAASIVGGADGSSLARKERTLLHIVSVTTQVVISRRVHRYKVRRTKGPPGS